MGEKVEVGVGDEIRTDVGNGEIRVISEEFMIIYDENIGGELCVHMEDHWWVPAEVDENSIDTERELEVSYEVKEKEQ